MNAILVFLATGTIHRKWVGFIADTETKITLGLETIGNHGIHNLITQIMTLRIGFVREKLELSIS